MHLPIARSTAFRFLGAGAILSLIMLAFLVLGRDPHSDRDGYRYILKNPGQYSPTISQGECDCSSAEPNGTEWEFNVQRDGNNHGLSESQCLSAFPKLFGESNRMMERRVASGNLITFKEVDDLARRGEDGMVRAAVIDGELYILDFGPMPYTFTRGKATLHSLHRALTAIPDRSHLPNIEFVFSTDDFSNGVSPIWSYSKRPEDEGVWLMPDFGYWAWPETQIGSYSEIRRQIATVDDPQELPFRAKKKQLAWRGGVAPNPDLRGSLLKATRGKSWASLREINWSDPDNVRQNLLPMQDYCRYMFLAHTEGRSFSGRGKYLLNCRSVVVSHKLQWLEAHHGALIASGPEANFVEVERDFSDLERKIEFLLDNPAAAERIAENAVRTFRDRYLTPAAESCYWRHLVRRYAEASAFEPVLFEERKGMGRVARGVSFESWALMQG
ncbi:glycosyl transferase family 90-domain-containing protein [Aspergillus egyptiacus]|nr:glycosyl transferase family 90-domain-containing protein [Aspergillus egyptiacus]